ncbi:MAG: hypothetical protein JWO82_2401 [Akkermansiaceae bacterium]|nr:hypothetical protein [Akkermansiaceae bacterium]
MRIGSTALAALGALLLPGCVTYSTIKDEPRTEVRFVSAKATEVFYRAYRDPVPEKKHEIWVRLPLPYWQYSKDSDNIRFNRALQKADANRDGVITEKEAAAFAEREKEKETEDLKTSDARPEGGGAGV